MKRDERRRERTKVKALLRKAARLLDEIAHWEHFGGGDDLIYKFAEKLRREAKQL